MNHPDYGSPVLNAWCTASQTNWLAYTDHAFVRGLGDGSLPRTAFLHYLVQDYLFLIHFSRAWAMAIVKSDSLEEMRIATSTVNALVNEEMQLHIATCDEAGISKDELFNAIESLETVAYTRYVLDAGLAGDFLDLLCALSPCVFGYGHIGLALAGRSAKVNPYQDWIDMYSGADYQQLCEQVGELLQQAALRRLGNAPDASPRWSSLCKRFDTATRLEVSFWEMGLRAKS